MQARLPPPAVWYFKVLPMESSTHTTLTRENFFGHSMLVWVYRRRRSLIKLTDELTDDDLLALMHFIRKRAHDDADISNGERVGH